MNSKQKKLRGIARANAHKADMESRKDELSEILRKFDRELVKQTIQDTNDYLARLDSASGLLFGKNRSRGNNA